MITSSVENPVNELLETLNHSSARLRLKLAALSLPDKVEHLELGLVDSRFNLFHGLHIGDGINDTNTEAGLKNPVVGNLLDLVHKALVFLPSGIEPGGVNEATHTTSNHLFVDCALNKFSLNYSHFVVVGVERVRQRAAIRTLGRTIVRLTFQIDLRQDE